MLSPKIGRYFSGALAVVGVILALGSTALWYELSDARKHWNQVEGVIRKSGVHNTRVVKQVQWAEVELAYDYTHRGNAYQGRRYTLGDDEHPADQTAALAGRFRPGDRVSVYCNPDDPAESALELRNDDTWQMLFVGVILWVLAAIGWKFSFPRNQSSASAGS